MPPEHLRYFAFPTSLVERLCAGGTDAYGFGFSFTSQDGSLRYCCAVCGADPSVRAGARPVSLVLMCRWPLPRAALLFAKQLFMLEQRQRSGWLGLRPNAAAMAAALRASQHELTFLMGHPLWLPFSLEPLLQALTRNRTLTLTL